MDAADLALLCCPGCGADLEPVDRALSCVGCAHVFPIQDGIPHLFWPNEWEPRDTDVTEAVKAFYEETPFPNYDDFDSVASLARKAREGRFAKLLDEQVPPGAGILECGCGTGQLTNFLSVANRNAFGTDICLNSLRLGQAFRDANDLTRAHFLQMNLFRPALKPGQFDLVIANGVLHHTSRPRSAFESIARLARPGGYVLVGLYHRYGRLITDLRRVALRLTGDRLTFLDPNLRRSDLSAGKWKAWLADQYKHPHESKHTMTEVAGWFERTGLDFVKSIPRSRPFRPLADDEPLFRPEPLGGPLQLLAVELGMIATGSREGGFFIMIGRRPEDGPSDQKSV